MAREIAVQTTTLQYAHQKACLVRFMYAQHLWYGLLIDLAHMVWQGEPYCVSAIGGPEIG